jgi:hypothetical protein
LLVAAVALLCSWGLALKKKKKEREREIEREREREQITAPWNVRDEVEQIEQQPQW